ncbi:hypothetical protein H0H93_007418 [Arthromyces matolae]|nr:hypothetical protein H0H93_007418 [Arthromyces matolae]
MKLVIGSTRAHTTVLITVTVLTISPLDIEARTLSSAKLNASDIVINTYSNIGKAFIVTKIDVKPNIRESDTSPLINGSILRSVLVSLVILEPTVNGDEVELSPVAEMPTSSTTSSSLQVVVPPDEAHVPASK